MPQLRKLSMSYCNIRVLSDSFVNIPNLKELILSQNEIFVISSPITSLRNLSTLDMHFSTRDVELFTFVFTDFGLSQLENLQNLTLYGIPIKKSINRYYLFGLKSLKYLDLADTKIVDIEEFSFETLRDLEILDLSYNSIRNIRENLFYGLNNLRILELRENLISFAKDSLPFQHLPRLLVLNLRNNKVKTLNSDMFSSCSSLTHLMLESNLLTSWNRDIFQNNSQLLALLLRRNQINQVTDTMLKGFSRLRILDLSYNPFSCECGIHIRFQKWLMVTNVTVVNYNNRNYPLAYVCSEPKEMEGNQLLDALGKCDVSNNRKIGSIVVAASVLATLVVFVILVALSCWYFRG
ncbi:uncharacterized protein LOC143230168 [Tachypleus tridentatus]|uniref:uncharacterized protein LOC143230168 n=1 Tax=Tachypleus tridentatus TaxID=6853 RepID=UPI003FD214C8